MAELLSTKLRFGPYSLPTGYGVGDIIRCEFRGVEVPIGRPTDATIQWLATLRAKDIRTNAFSVASPDLNGRVERVIQRLKYECLFKSILFGQRHLDHTLSEWVIYYNTRRTHGTRSLAADP